MSKPTLTYFLIACIAENISWKVKQWLGIPESIVNYMGLIRWIHWKNKCYKFQKLVMYAVVNATLYEASRVRNEVIWNQKLPTVAHTFGFVQQSVIDRM